MTTHDDRTQPDWLHLKAYGYAPGGYMVRCSICHQMVYDNDKRSTCCRPCAEKRYASEHQQAEPAASVEQAPAGWKLVPAEPTPGSGAVAAYEFIFVAAPQLAAPPDAQVEPSAYRFICKKPGETSEYVSLDPKGPEFWPWDEWKTVHRVPLVDGGISEQVWPRAAIKQQEQK